MHAVHPLHHPRHATVLGLALGAAFASCFPGPYDETDKRCDAQRPCGSGFVCLATGRCGRAVVSDGGAGGNMGGGPGGGAGGNTGGGLGGGSTTGRVNLLQNSGFEDGDPPTGWTGFPLPLLSQASGHSGSKSALVATTGVTILDAGLRFGPDGGYSRYGTLQPQSSPGDAGTGTYCAEVWVRGQGDTSLEVFVQSASTNPPAVPLSAQWQRLTHQASLAQPGQVTPFLLVLGNEEAEHIEADDFVLWRSADGTCTEP